MQSNIFSHHDDDDSLPWKRNSEVYQLSIKHVETLFSWNLVRPDRFYSNIFRSFPRVTIQRSAIDRLFVFIGNYLSSYIGTFWNSILSKTKRRVNKFRSISSTYFFHVESSPCRLYHGYRDNLYFVSFFLFSYFSLLVEAKSELYIYYMCLVDVLALLKGRSCYRYVVVIPYFVQIVRSRKI